MKRLLAAMAIGLVLSSVAPAATRGVEPLRQGTFAQLVSQRSGQSFLLVLWSVTCAPCRAEFELLAELRKQHPGLPLLLISTDDIVDQVTIVKVLARYGLQREPNWAFADPDVQRLRFEIDPGWYGEMPRAYFYEPDGSRAAVSGSLEREQIEAWLARPAPPELAHREFSGASPAEPGPGRR